MTPGAEPLKALAESFLDTWQFSSTDPERVKQQKWLDRAAKQWRGHAARSARRYRAALQGTGADAAARFPALCRPGRGAVCALRRASATSLLGNSGAGGCRPASLRADEPAGRFLW